MYIYFNFNLKKYISKNIRFCFGKKELKGSMCNSYKSFNARMYMHVMGNWLDS